MTYARARRLDPMSGDFVYDATDTFAESPSPGLEMVLLALRTPLGSCRARPTFGTPWSRVDKLRATAAADAQGAIREGLAFAVRSGAIRDLRVLVETDADSGRLVYAVDFTDVRLGRRVPTVTGQVP